MIHAHNPQCTTWRREGDRRVGGWGVDMFICGGYEFPVTTEKVRSITDLYPHNYDHHQTTVAITNGERTQDITKDWGGGNRDTLCCTNVIHFNA